MLRCLRPIAHLGFLPCNHSSSGSCRGNMPGSLQLVSSSMLAQNTGNMQLRRTQTSKRQPCRRELQQQLQTVKPCWAELHQLTEDSADGAGSAQLTVMTAAEAPVSQSASSCRLELPVALLGGDLQATCC
eukprot:GHUV01052941.1.p1 GENE.GHUV01052941.1~~GHUV01052941.1.p1  ORF type:complete len:130 (+),score=35.14 GHUV01052941.1:242-631(+)